MAAAEHDSPSDMHTVSRRADHEATWCGLTAAARHRHIDGSQTWIRHEEAVEKLSATQAEIGFAPQAVAEGARYQLRLHQCLARTLTAISQLSVKEACSTLLATLAPHPADDIAVLMART